ncbi:hypothetical protein NA57DRAFT_72172 [Rhizodiscina lignyota]|uniref:Uncharacterized protein n=1 Tax=Rhizodiscina lignyota TaxID=1504668 RepID=A0A9P4INP5_9PEZI|nr:hypothetical protein NA57DRAFT_72172 [Rhizodiscina lignyota]
MAVFKDKAFFNIVFMSASLMRVFEKVQDPPSPKNSAMVELYGHDFYQYQDTPENDLFDHQLAIETAMSFRNARFYVCLSPYFGQENEYRIILKFLRHIRENHARIHGEATRQTEIVFCWWELLCRTSHVTEEEFARGIGMWREASAALDALTWTLRCDHSIGSLLVKRDLRFSVIMDNQKWVLFPTRDKKGRVHLQNYKPGTARPAEGFRRRLRDTGVLN